MRSTGRKRPVVEYLQGVFERAGIETRIFFKAEHRPNLVARLRGSGAKRPLLLMAHTDTVNVDPAKWKHPPFSAARESGHIYGRGTVDDKDHVAIALMTMLLLKRTGVALDRERAPSNSASSSLYRFLRFHWEIVLDLAAAR